MKATQGNLRDGERERTMYCPFCGNEASADKADYWYINDQNFKYRCCGSTMNIVVKRVIHTPV